MPGWCRRGGWCCSRAARSRSPCLPSTCSATASVTSSIRAYAVRCEGPSLPLLRDRHRNAGNFHLDAAEVVAAGEVERLPVATAKGDVGGRRRTMDDAAELLALRVHDPDAAGAAAIDIPFDIDLHAVGHARLVTAQIDEDTVALPCQHAVWVQLECTNVAAPRIVDVQRLFVGRERQPV